MIDHLAEIRGLLERYGCGQARVIEKAIGLYADKAAFAQQMQMVDMWGGAGAVWEVNFDPERRNPASGADRKRFMELIVKVHEDMEREGIATPRSAQIADVFRQWLREERY